jgi:putative transposase
MNTLTAISLGHLLRWCELCPRKFARWRERYGKANEHNALVPRDHWLEPWEHQAIID